MFHITTLKNAIDLWQCYGIIADGYKLIDGVVVLDADYIIDGICNAK